MVVAAVEGSKEGKNGKPPELTRTVFSISRASEYFDPTELQAQTGQTIQQFFAVLLKELCDNGIDAAEAAGVAPKLVIRIRYTDRSVILSVADNGNGIPPEVVSRILDVNTRTSDKAAYRAPTRGAMGNAEKTIIGIPFALGGRDPVLIEARGVQHVIRAQVNPAGQVRIDHQTNEIKQRPGTRVQVILPTNRVLIEPEAWADALALFNPHVEILVKIRRSEESSKHGNSRFVDRRFFYRKSVDCPGGKWRKHLPTDPTSPHWYDIAAFKTLLFLHIGNAQAGGDDLLLRDFVQQFKGLTSSAKAKAVCDRLPGIKRLSDFEQNPGRVETLLAAMKEEAKAPAPEILGTVGREHFEQMLDSWYGVKRSWYKLASLVVDGIPYIAEVMVAETEGKGETYFGQNFSPSFGDPLTDTGLYTTSKVGGKEVKLYAWGVQSYLDNAHCGRRTAAILHLVCPRLTSLDRAKSRVSVPDEVAEAVASSLWECTKVIYAEEERRKKDAARQERADEAREKQRRGPRVTLIEAVTTVIVQAIAKATGNGTLPVSAHTLFYHVRPLIQRFTDQKLTPKYFEQRLLPAYQQKYGAIEGLYYEPRGILVEPHTGTAVPLGTREVEAYRFPSWQYDKVLYIEKKGLWPVLKAARLAEKYDMAIVAGEGYATEACRALFSSAEADRAYQLFVAHDADPAGYNIARTLREKTWRMPGYSVNVIDIGLKLADALEMGLPTETFTRKKALPKELELSDLERKHFNGRNVGDGWIAQRVELNAMSGPQFIVYIERQLQASGVRPKVIPDSKHLPALAADIYRYELENLAHDALRQMFDSDEITRPIVEGFRRSIKYKEAKQWIVEAFEDDPYRDWKAAVKAKSNELLNEVAELLREAVRERMKEYLQGV